MAITQTYTADDVFELNIDTPFEVIDGELHILSPSGQDSSAIAGNVYAALHNYLKVHRLGVLTGEQGGFVVSRKPDTVFCPDVGFIYSHRLVNGRRFTKFVPVPPDFAVEVVSPSDRRPGIDEKVRRYLAAGTELVWLVEPGPTTVTVFTPGSQPRAYAVGETLSGGTVFPGFELPVSDVFE